MPAGLPTRRHSTRPTCVTRCSSPPERNTVSTTTPRRVTTRRRPPKRGVARLRCSSAGCGARWTVGATPDRTFGTCVPAAGWHASPLTTPPEPAHVDHRPPRVPPPGLVADIPRRPAHRDRRHHVRDHAVVRLDRGGRGTRVPV